MVRLKVTAKGQITLKKEVLDHLGVKPGDEIDVDLAPKKGATLRSVPKGKIEDFFGSLRNTNNIHATLDEIQEAIEAGWAGEVRFDDDDR
ncbi:AbrB/MazE/SpoVT family DNA-binding domain-containing protein [Neorhizobium sp. CSC1952]|uniref:AbrB/MazE/SpoVT family DNA-binding domain-containing protein n=1 Tax=Neorhizobium sp. CSC1952 TaxID=2978974 RepID=UPI0025A55725|nr:AbrB/MazE/SpoVT family DNA-binding domain-containing protein [Rhizobium sp. CSC1952]WJR66002.1 AbrB/MazE/SpoVT family DNA-binding domain-containing protein [Rhizobium sp. CSC1952]